MLSFRALCSVSGVTEDAGAQSIVFSVLWLGSLEPQRMLSGSHLAARVTQMMLSMCHTAKVMPLQAVSAEGGQKARDLHCVACWYGLDGRMPCRPKTPDALAIRISTSSA